MTHQKSSISRRSFLKSSALAGGGLMISFSALAELDLADKINELDLPVNKRFEHRTYQQVTACEIHKKGSNAYLHIFFARVKGNAHRYRQE